MLLSLNVTFENLQTKIRLSSGKNIIVFARVAFCLVSCSQEHGNISCVSYFWRLSNNFRRGAAFRELYAFVIGARGLNYHKTVVKNHLERKRVLWLFAICMCTFKGFLYLLKSESFLSSITSISSTISSTNLGEYLPCSVTSSSNFSSNKLDFKNFSICKRIQFLH